MGILLDRLHQDPGLREIWPLIIPPIITLVESSVPRYRLRGLQLSIHLLRNVPPLLICQTGINSILQNAFSTTFGLLNIQQTFDLLNAAFDASMMLIEVQWKASQQTPKDQANRYNQINQLMEESVFNALSFGKGQGHDGQMELHNFAVRRVIEITRELGYGIGRHIRVIMPYLCETLLNLTLSRASYSTVIEINKLLKLLFSTCEDLLLEWRSRLIVVLATCWIEWRPGPESKPHPVPSTKQHNVSQQELSDDELEAVRKSIVEDTLKSFIRHVGGSNGDAGHGDNQGQDEQMKELLKMMKTITDSHPLLNELFDPLFFCP